MFDISVVMPVYNTKEEYLREAIESILNQSFKNFEFIIVNDASLQFVEDIILSYNDERIKYIKNEKNLGVPGTLNVGLKAAGAKYIARFDSDDVSMKDRFKEQFDFLEKNPSYQLVATDITASKKTTQRGMNFEYQKAKLLYRSNCIIHPSVMFRRDFFEQNNLYYDEQLKYGEDWDLWVRFVFCGGKFVILPNKLVFYRQHENQANKIYAKRHNDFSKRQFGAIFDFIGFKVDEKIKDLFLDFMCTNLERKTDFKEILSIYKEMNRLIKHVKKTKLSKSSYVSAILYKKFISYAKKSLFSKG